jgi:hypothetical protein
MSRKTFSLKYTLLTYRLDMLWLPAAFWALFILLVWIIPEADTRNTLAHAYFGVALPLIGGILGAYAVLEDPALELQFATPRPVWQLLAERNAMIVAILGVCALSYQGVIAVLGFDLSPLGGFILRQLAWLVPTLAMVGLSAALSFAVRQPMAGAAATGMIWMIQLMYRDLFLAGKIGPYFLLMMGSNYSDHPALRANQAVLTVLAVLCGFVCLALLRRQEAFL